MALKIGIVRFPGSNCDFDTLKWFQRGGHTASFIWYTENSLPYIDLLVLPGGFAFGDRAYQSATGSYTIDPGKLALDSPVMRRVATSGIPILGICNGFQILTKYGLLPGRLLRNDSEKFYCNHATCEVTGVSFFGDRHLLGEKLSIPVAHGYGKYVPDSRIELRNIENEGMVFLRYADGNPNGSVNNIAGVCNKSMTVFGMMPHPERSPVGHLFIRAIERYTNAKMRHL